MSYISIKSNYFPMVVPRADLDVTEQSITAQPETNTGVANSADMFETARPTEFMQQQTLPPANVELSPPPDQTLEASAMFDFVSGVLEPQAKDVLGKLTDAINEGKKANGAMQRAFKNSQDMRKDD